MTISAATKVRPQVFVSFALSDRSFADEISDALTESGLTVVRMDDVAPGGEYTDVVRKALRRSAAVVVVLSQVSLRRDVPASVLFEVGAAAGADKPIFVIVDEPTTKLPFHVSNLHVLPPGRVGEIARHVGAA